MKRYGNLYPQIYDMDNLREAHRNARKGKLHYRDVQLVDRDPERHLLSVHNMLKNKLYRTSPYHVWTKRDGPKDRTIYVLPYYPDRIVQWAIVQVLEPIWMSTFIPNTYSSLKGRGIHQGLRDLQRYLKDRPGTEYCLKFDVAKFYPSMDHDVLKGLLRKKIKDPDVLGLLDEIVDSVGTPKNVPIGNYLSQYLGNVYLSGLDHWIKEELGARYYMRYCDDGVVLSGSKRWLHELRERVDEYLQDRLNLRMKDNWQVFPTRTRGIDYLGYRFFGDRLLLRERTARQLKRKMRAFLERGTYDDKVRSSVASYTGWLGWCDGHGLYEKYIEQTVKRLGGST